MIPGIETQILSLSLAGRTLSLPADRISICSPGGSEKLKWSQSAARVSCVRSASSTRPRQAT